MPEIAAPAKIAKIKAYGAEAIIGGTSYAEAQQRCDGYVAETGALLIHPYDAVETIGGQGTVALEWEEDLERLGSRSSTRFSSRLAAAGSSLESLLGSRAGSRSSASSRKDRARFMRLWRRTRQSTWTSSRSPPTCSARSGSASSISRSRKQFVSEVVLVADTAIVEAQRRLWADVSVIAEPGGAAAFAAVASGAYRPEQEERVGVLVCGANADLATFAQGGEARAAVP